MSHSSSNQQWLWSKKSIEESGFILVSSCFTVSLIKLRTFSMTTYTLGNRLCGGHVLTDAQRGKVIDNHRVAGCPQRQGTSHAKCRGLLLFNTFETDVKMTTLLEIKRKFMFHEVTSVSVGQNLSHCSFIYAVAVLSNHLLLDGPLLINSCNISKNCGFTLML